MARQRTKGTADTFPSGDIDVLSAFARLKAALQRTAEPIPEGFHTPLEYAELMGCGRSQVERYIREGLKSGLVERRDFRVPRNNGTTMVKAHYRILDVNPAAGGETKC